MALKRSGFKFNPSAQPMARTPFKSKPRKKSAGHDKATLNLCRGQICYLRVPDVCRSYDGDPTVVPCHGNGSEFGKGMGIKAADEFTVPGCFYCHAWLDQGSADREIKDATFKAALEAWTIDRQKIREAKAAKRT